MPERPPDARPLDMRLLVLAPTGRDAELTCGLLARASLEAASCATMQALCHEARLGASGLILADEVLTPAGMTLVTELVASQEPWSDLPVLLFTGREATVQTRNPTLELLAPLGNVTLLDRPVRPITMVSAARSALRARRRQYAARTELERQQAAVRKRDEFLAMLGHEIRNPLGSIGLAAELLARGGEGLALGGRIRRQVRHLSHLVDDLLDVSRVSSGKLVLQRQLVALDEIVRRAVESVRPSADAKGLGLSVTAEPATVDGDAVRLEQVFGNLLGNAVKYTQDGGNISAELSVEDGAISVAIRDDGAGIELDMLQEVFEPFVQARHTLDRADGGLGIGLTLVRSLIELHGGTVEVASEGLGTGSVFWVRLPRALETPTVSEFAPEETQARPLKVLIVEDHDDVRDLLRALIEGFGHEVEVASDGGTGLASALRGRPDVMLVDIGLPVLDGYGLARGIREQGMRTMMIALTGYGQPEDRSRALDAGFDLHCTKPVDPMQLERLLREPLLGLELEHSLGG